MPAPPATGPRGWRVVPTELGVKGLVLFAVLEIAFLATSYSNLFFLLLVFCASLGACGLWWTVANVRAVRVACVVRDGDARHGGTVVDLHVRVRDRRTAGDVGIALTIAGRRHDVLHHMHVASDLVARAVLPELPRGVHRITAVAVGSRHPFGLFHAVATRAVDALVVVPPRPWSARDAAARGSGHDAAAAAATAGVRSQGVHGLRAFRPGDALVDVHWKASARRGEPVVKERERDAGGCLEFVVDRAARGEAFEAGLRDAATWLAAAVVADRPCVLRSDAYRGVVSGGGRGAVAVWRWLAAVTPLATSSAIASAGAEAAAERVGQAHADA
jgi:uncharacterized protein (DUF58 family)